MTRVIVGFTGASGAGKGTGANALIHQLRAQLGGTWTYISTSEPLLREVERRLVLTPHFLDDRRQKETHRKELDKLQLELRRSDPEFIMKQAIMLHPDSNIIVDRPCTDDDFEVLLREQALFVVITAPEELRREKMGIESFEKANACDSEQAMFRNLRNLRNRTDKIIEVENTHYEPESLELRIHSQIYHYFDDSRPAG